MAVAAAPRASKVIDKKPQTVSQRIEQATARKPVQVVLSELHASDADNVFYKNDFEGTGLLTRGCVAEALRDLGLSDVLQDGFAAFAKLAFDAHSADSHFLSFTEFRQLYCRLTKQYPQLLPRPTTLKITVMSAKGLPSLEQNGKPDVFCMVQVVGKPKTLSHTKLVEKTLDPWWGEEFTDKYGYEPGDILQFQVFHHDKTSAAEHLCSASLRSSEFHRAGGFEGALPLLLAPEFQNSKCMPKLKVRVAVKGLAEPPPALRILVRGAEGLPHDISKPDPFCTVMLTGKPFSKSQTKAQSKTTEPVWNETFTDKSRYDEGDNIVFKIYDYDKSGKHELQAEATLDSTQFHRVGGFDGKLALSSPMVSNCKALLGVKVIVRDLEFAPESSAGEDCFRMTEQQTSPPPPPRRRSVLG